MSDPQLPLDQILQGDCVDVLAGLPAGSADLIFADPPYNLQLSKDLWRPNMTKVDAVTDDWDQFASFREYDRFSRAWLTACRRVLKDTGSIWVIGTYHNIYRLGVILQDLGFWVLNEVVWVKTNPMPNFRGVRFTNAHETLIWARKSEKSRYTFNYHEMKALNGGKQMRSDWYIPICAGPERIRVNGQKVHSTQKPEALLRRVILSSSRPGDVVLDPFFGTGTTGAVAQRLQRHWIGIERDPLYVQIAHRRLEQIQPEILMPAPDDRRAVPRVEFAELVRQSYLQPGQSLYFRADRARVAQVTAEGQLTLGDFTGSIHQAGRRLQGGAPCNGWEHWYFEDVAGQLQPLDVLRRQYRQVHHSGI